MNSKLPAFVLLTFAALGIGMAWWLYPAENEFSIMRCTISFLGSPDPDRNPMGWRWQQWGMTSLILALSQMIWWRHRNCLPFTGPLLWVATALYATGFGLVLVSVWITDSDDLLWGRYRSGTVHTRIAIYGILMVMFAVIADGVILARAGLPGRARWPFRIYAAIWVATILSLASWEWKCRLDPTLHHWPGDGIHSTPMWEWVLFTCLIGFVIWISRRRLVEGMPPRG